MLTSRHMAALIVIALTGGGLTVAHAAIQDSDKISNNTSSAKAALKGIQPSGNAPKAPTASIKIASLDTAEIKAAALPGETTLTGEMAQGGMVFGRTEPGAQVKLDGTSVMVDKDGWFTFGFHRDHPATADLAITYPNGVTAEQTLTIRDREFNIERIDGLPSNQVNQYTKEELEKIRISTEKKNAARGIRTESVAYWKDGFDWPATGRISGRMGSQRILNGVAKNPHSGTDVAVPTGTPIKAPADGVITLADMDMYFEGGLIFLDHGHWINSYFMHLSRIDVEAGDFVKKGDVIGAVGSTGRSTGPHLHWTLKWKDRVLDPELITGPMPE